MPNQTFEIAFSINLAPYAQGLKTMLTMTSEAGRQIQPLLNIETMAPNFTGIDAQLASYKTKLQEVAQAEQQVAAGAAPVAPGLDKVGKTARSSAEGVEAHSESLRGMRREFGHIFGALGFLAVSLTELAASTAGTDKSVQKFTSSMEKGVTQGFGLMMMMQMIQGSITPVGMGISALVAVGASLLTFFDNSEQKAKLAAAAMDSFKASLRGGTVEQLEQQAALLDKEIEGQMKRAQDLETRIAKARTSAGELSQYGGSPTSMKDYISPEELAAAKKELSNLTPALDANKEKINETYKAIQALQETEPQLQKHADELVIQSITDKYGRMKAEALKARDDEITRAQTSLATEKTKNSDIEAARQICTNKLREIAAQEYQDRLKYETLIRDLEQQTALVTLEIEEKDAIDNEENERKQLDIKKQYAIKRNEMQRNEELAKLQREQDYQNSLGTDEGYKKADEIANQMDKVNELWDARNDLVRENTDLAKENYDVANKPPPAGSILEQQNKVAGAQKALNEATTDSTRQAAEKQLEIEQHKLQKMTDMNKDAREMWIESHQTAMEGIRSITAGFQTMYNQFIIGDRQAKDQWDAVWLSMRNRALNDLGAILEKEIEHELESVGIHETAEGEKTAATQTGVLARIGAIAGEIGSELASAGASMVKAVAAAIEWEMSMLGPLGFLAIPADVAGLYGLYEGAKAAFGLEEGGIIRKGERGFFEGKGTEIVAPEQTFHQFAAEELLPKLLNKANQMVPQAVARIADRAQQSGATMAKMDTRAMEKELRATRAAIESLGSMKVKIEGSDLFLVWNLANDRFGRLKY
jgi:hypothetical protein